MRSKRAFTLIELLVVIAVIAMLLAILLPSLTLVKRKAAAAVCLVNTKNLSVGWYIYQDENDGRIMSCRDTAVEDNGQYVGWIGIPRDAQDNMQSIVQISPAVTDEDEIRGIEVGLLYPYLKGPKVYHCPADTVRRSKYDGTLVYVSYGIPMCLYEYTNAADSMYNMQIKRHGEITSPSDRYLFVESAETRNWNSSHHFALASPEYTGQSKWGWWGPMAVNHGDSSILGFCDGHSEIRKWRDPYTRERVDKIITTGGDTYGIDYPPDDQQADIEYMAAGWPYRYKIGR